MPQEVKERLSETLPQEGAGAASAYADFIECVLPYPNGNLHPRFFGWAQSNGTPLGMMADMLASGLNPYLGGFNQAPALVEDIVLQWFKTLMGYPAAASGLLTVGGSMSNTLALAVARQSICGVDFRTLGIHGQEKRLRFYASAETHRCIVKAIEFLGMGSESFRAIPVDGSYRMDIGALRAAIADDRNAGLKPVAVVGTAGTTNTGSIDDLKAISTVCKDESIWFHVDGAWGAFARLSARLAPLVAGIEESDSLSFNFHKWLFQPADAACILVRDGTIHRETFSSNAEYFVPMDRGIMVGGMRFADLGVDTTRSFRALKIWMCLKAEGVAKLASVIEYNVFLAQHLESLIYSSPELELVAPVNLNVVCFRFFLASLSNQILDELNLELLLRIQESGVAAPSNTIIHGKFVLRCAILNHRTTLSDIEILVESLIAIGLQIAAERFGNAIVAS